MTTSSNPTSASEKTYFDLHTTGVGYLNRIREVTPENGERYLACEIAALTGRADKKKYCYFDLRVSGRKAQQLVRDCEEAVKAESTVQLRFRLGDLWTDLFTHKRGKNAGKTGVSLKARLIFIDWIKIDGKMVYKAEPKSFDNEEREPPAPAADDALVAPPAATPEPSPPAADGRDTAVAEAPAEAGAIAA